MSYDISLCDPISHKTLTIDSPHFICGGTYAVGGTTELWMTVTYNYGKTGAESIPILEKAIAALGDDVDDTDYWHGTEGNAKRALCGLLAFARMRPDGVWEGD